MSRMCGFDEPFELPETRNFTGRERDADGKLHNVSRTSCGNCGAILSEFHFGCCGHASSGHGTMGAHKCKKP